MGDKYVVYCIYTEIEGVFYIGCGRHPVRLKNTVTECEQASDTYSMKCRYIRSCHAHGIRVHTWIVCLCNDKQHAEEIEYALIQMYPSALTNSLLNWHPMRQLPPFLQKLHAEPERAKSAQEQGSRSSEGDLLASRDAPPPVNLERFHQAVNTILAYNDAVSTPDLRWYINVPVVCDLLGGHPSNEKIYLVKKYLARRRDELEAHHKKYGLRERDSRKPVRITERVKIKPAVAYEPYLERFQRATDVIIAYNDTVYNPDLRWYICAAVVHDLLGGRSSGIKNYALINQYLANRRDELEAHHKKYGLVPEQNQKRDIHWNHRNITKQVNVDPAVAGEPYWIRFQRATDAIVAYNDTVYNPELRWYICAGVVYDLLGGRSSGILRYLVEQYLANRRDELGAHHRKHGLKPSHSHKLLHIAECLKIETEEAEEFSVTEGNVITFVALSSPKRG